MTERAVATFTIKRAGDMAPEMRREIAAWLRSNAEHLEQQGQEYSRRFVARYILTGPLDKSECVSS